MTNNNNNLPIHAEQQFIQQKIKIPTNFIELKTVGKNYICSTQGWPKEPVCERYMFFNQGKSIQLDIPHELMAKLELDLGKEIICPIYISPAVLDKKPDEFGGITIKDEKDIICQKEGTILVQEKDIQVDFTSGEITDLKTKLEKSEQLSQETQKLLERISKDNEEKYITIIFFEQQIKDLTQRITELRNDLGNEILAKKREESKNQELQRIIKKLKEDEQVLIGLQNKISGVQKELGDQIIALTEERDNIKTDLNDLKDKLESRLQRIKKAFLNSLSLGISRNSKKKKEIKDLEVRMARLRVQLFDKNKEIEKLISEKGNLQTQLREREQTITNLRTNLSSESSARTRIESENNNLRSQLSSTQSNYDYYYRQCHDKDREVDNLKGRVDNLRSEVSSLQSRWNNLPPEQDFILVTDVQTTNTIWQPAEPGGYEVININKNNISREDYTSKPIPRLRVGYYHARGRISSWGWENGGINYLKNVDWS